MDKQKATILGMLAAACLFGCSRSPEVTWKHLLQEHNGNVVWDMTGLCVVFEGIRGGPTLGSAGDLQLSGDIPCGGCGGVPGDTNYSSEQYDGAGVATLQFRNYQLQIKQGGRAASVQGVEFSLAGKPKQTITVHLKGQPTMRDFRASDSSGEPLGDISYTSVWEVRSNQPSAQLDGAVNRSRPVGSETNGMSATAGSGG